MNKKEKIIEYIIQLTEKLTDNIDVDKNTMLKALKLINSNQNFNLDIYKGYILLYYYYKFKKLPKIKAYSNLIQNNIFKQCIKILNCAYFTPQEIKKIYATILVIPDTQTELRDVLIGSFLASLWTFMNNPDNLNLAIKYGLAITKAAFEFDKFNYISNKIKINAKNAKIINPCGSGKKRKEFKLLNISSMVAVILATIGIETNQNIVVAKTASRGVSSVTGSSDIFSFLGVNLNISNNEMAKIAVKTKLGIFNINNTVPRLNHIYDNRIYNVQVFAGLIGGAAVVCPVDVDLINYGLTRGSNKVCLGILKKIYPDKNIIITTGQNKNNNQIIDQISIMDNTNIAESINGKISYYKITPKNLGFECGNIKNVQTKNTQKKNAQEFVKLLLGKNNSTLESLIAMETAMNLYGIGVVKNLKIGASIALKMIKSGNGIKVLEKLIVLSGGDIKKLQSLM
ncbi:hypothetical protein KAU09_02115 [Candidatus Parcubacteria bacterium]|nr:hypothetical protein [Candidatus Parcubacteria bacterium]